MNTTEAPAGLTEKLLPLWIDSHQLFLTEAKDKEPDVLFIGDSHVALLEQSEVYHDLFAPLHCLCFGIMNETSDRLLWRIEHGELDDIKPKIIVISIGSFNTCDIDQTVTEIQKIVSLIRQKQANAHLFLLKLLPVGRHTNKRREFGRKVNEKLEELVGSDDKKLAALSMDAGFVGTDGTIDHHDMFDYFHLSKEGYRKAFDLVFTAVHSVLFPDN